MVEAESSVPRPLDALYLSPHLDDVVLSCGGQIYDRVMRGERVMIATVFTADALAADRLSAFARAQLETWNTDATRVMAARRAEDRAAGCVLGSETVHLDLDDAMFRTREGRPRSTTWDAILDGAADAEMDVLDNARRAIEALPAARFIAAPLGAGHIDHRLVRAAAEATIERMPASGTRASGPTLHLYEDLPYALARRRRWTALGLRSVVARRVRAVTIPLSTDARAAKDASLRCYASQNPEGCLIPASARGLDTRGGERLWHRRD